VQQVESSESFAFEICGVQQHAAVVGHCQGPGSSVLKQLIS